MTTIQPDGEQLRKAVRWIAEEQKAGSTKTRRQLMDEACLVFNLTPVEAEYLTKSFEETS